MHHHKILSVREKALAIIALALLLTLVVSGFVQAAHESRAGVLLVDEESVINAKHLK